MMLTVAAYSAVVASFLPVVGYNTLLHNSVLCSFFCYLVIVLQVSFVGLVASARADNSEEYANDVPHRFAALLSGVSVTDMDRVCFTLDLAAVFVAHLCLVYRVRCRIMPQEFAKHMDELADEREQRDEGQGYAYGHCSDDSSNESEEYDQRESRTLLSEESRSRRRSR
eukprot:CAMPEP_0177437914 /NCGR_PEP_ID=MMETSP0369-20130122/2460_1 /TAXON_ID=447022 ORGANISM="Scrippsiella hangoei-like, Strain SHHI-4" /NCGR_SAMPLE_ID=MMETSP0369 /ASSEMBLY_ACC=CAM_ASM_000364 /LENGTH=168 /DNA_ID=CAMNT_0018909415 /DNA_START=120 /DNA_END=626 /DNA_ORIENTATION=-